jgi:glycosyltransferase involved in cell wall biosynthesis
VEPEPPRKVAVLIDSLLGGGAERVAVENARALDPNRYVGHLIVTRISGPLEALVRDSGLACTVLGRRRGFSPRAFLTARSVVRSVDLLHAHKFPGAMWGSLIAWSSRRPLIVHEHTFDGRSSRLRSFGYRHVIARAAKRILCVAPSVEAALIDDGVPRALLQVIPNGVPVDVAVPRTKARAELALEDAGIVIGLIARLRPEKQHELALEALALLRAQGHDVTLCCVGDGPRLDELQQLAGRLGIAAHVVWAGERPNAGRLVRAFDIAVLCSAYEGMPLAALEVLVAGVPLVATAVGSLPILLAEGGGRVVPNGDVRALANALSAELALLDNETRAATASTAAERFGLERMIRDIQHVYDEVLAGQRP